MGRSASPGRGLALVVVVRPVALGERSRVPTHANSDVWTVWFASGAVFGLLVATRCVRWLATLVALLATLLDLYALYKQASSGDVSGGAAQRDGRGGPRQVRCMDKTQGLSAQRRDAGLR